MEVPADRAVVGPAAEAGRPVGGLSVVERSGRLCVGSDAAAKWEASVGYSRAVRSGPFIAVSGTVGVEADGSYAPTVGAQTRRALAIISAAVESLGGTLGHVIRTRIFVTDISAWEEVGAAHAEFFGAIRPATSMVEVSRLIDPRILVEVEADAVVPGTPTPETTVLVDWSLRL